MHFVIVEKNQASAPSPEDMKRAMVKCNGTPGEVTGDNSQRKLTFTGEISHTTYENTLIEVAKGKRTSWNFTWADANVKRTA